jgi:general secretion pathway protein N
MKKWFGLLALFLSSYLVFIVLTLPVSLLINNVPLPKNIHFSGVQGTIWHAQIAQVNLGNTRLEKVTTRLSFLSLLSLSPEVELTFGDALLSGPEGEFTLRLSSDELSISKLSLLVAANDIISQVTLPLPATAQGNLEVLIDEMRFNYVKSDFNTLTCNTVVGSAIWNNAGVVALEKNVKLGKFSADLSCKNEAVTVIVNPKNNLGLSFSLYARMNRNLTGDGYLEPGEKFPQVLQSALPFLGNRNAQGRYLLKF